MNLLIHLWSYTAVGGFILLSAIALLAPGGLHVLLESRYRAERTIGVILACIMWYVAGSVIAFVIWMLFLRGG